jgi:hypothetical protein
MDDDTEKPTRELIEEYSRAVVLSFRPECRTRALEIIDELTRRGVLSETKRPFETVPPRRRKRHLRIVRS